MKNVSQKAIKTNSSFSYGTSNVPMFSYRVIKMNKIDIYTLQYNILRFQKSWKCSKNLANVRNKKKNWKKMSKYRNTVLYDFKSPVLVIFSSDYRHRLVLKIPFPNHIFFKISKYRTKYLPFQSTSKYCGPLAPHPPTGWYSK